MTTFVYRACPKDQRNRRLVRGRIQASSLMAARQQLIDQQLQPISLRPARQRLGWWLHAQASNRFVKRPSHRLSLSEREQFTRQCAMLLQAGLPVLDALIALRQQSPKQHMMLTGLIQALHQGSSLSRAMALQPAAFDNSYCAAVHAGEMIGLVPVLQSLSTHLAQQVKVQAQYRQALMYPLITLGFASAVMVLLLTTILPQLVGAIQRPEATLPWITQVLLHVSHHVAAWGLWDVAGCAMMLGSHVYAYRHLPAWRHRCQSLLLRLPWVGQLLKHISAQAYLHTLGLLLQSGMHLSEAMPIAQALLRWHPMQTRMASAMTKVETGTPLHDALQATGDFPAMCIPMIYCGSVDGHLGQAVKLAAEDLHLMNQSRIRKVMSLLEPATILLVGGVVLVIALGTLLPIFDFDTMVY